MTTSSQRNEFKASDLEHIFQRLFFKTHNTILVFGAEEPFYQAAKNDQDCHKIYCRADFYSSGLHEIAHWCIAGKERRLQDDYGYWYQPDGRSLEQQKSFELVEVKPQALEKIFCDSINYQFLVSADNLHLISYSTKEFSEKVKLQAEEYMQEGLIPPRAKQFIEGLKEFYQTSLV